ncbi:MAG TPA: cytochrome P450 [Baekduia sp.]|nr:cytochrome P450 [Baekduia sp.]
MTESAVAPNPLRGAAAPSSAGPVESLDPSLAPPPLLPVSRNRQTLYFVWKPYKFQEWAKRECGDVFRMRVIGRKEPFHITSHPDHIKAIFLAKPDNAPSITGDSPLRPILGPGTVLTAIGQRHMRQRKLLLPSFHGDAIAAYTESIEQAITKELDSWRAGSTVELAPRMSAVTLDVIMAGVFGLDGEPTPGSPEDRVRKTLRRLLSISAKPWFPVVERRSLGHDSAQFPLNLVTDRGYAAIDRVIAARRAVPESERGADVMSLLMSATDEEGVPLSDYELRMELLTLLLAGHETTANALAWLMERMVRTPEPYDALRDAVRAGGEESDAYIEAAINEGMRVRPVIPMVGRVAQSPWHFGEFAIEPGSPIIANIMGVHMREDVYPDAKTLRPERFLGSAPGTYEWIPFGGGIRRCLGASLAMAEQRVVLREMTRRVDMTFDKPEAEGARLRNVTLIPTRGGRVRLTRVSPA